MQDMHLLSHFTAACGEKGGGNLAFKEFDYLMPPDNFRPAS